MRTLDRKLIQVHVTTHLQVPNTRETLDAVFTLPADYLDVGKVRTFPFRDISSRLAEKLATDSSLLR